MITVYKLTDSYNITRNDTCWELGKWLETDGVEQELCNSSWLHAYSHPLLAALLWEQHVDYDKKRLYRAEAKGNILREDNGSKLGASKMRIMKRIRMPRITLRQKQEIVLRGLMKYYKNKEFVKWAKNWLSGKDRSYKNVCNVLKKLTTGLLDDTIYSWFDSLSCNLGYIVDLMDKEVDVLSIAKRVVKKSQYQL